MRRARSTIASPRRATDMTIRTSLLEARLHRRRRKAVRDAAARASTRRSSPRPPANSSPPNLPSATRASKRAGRVALSRRAQREGGQGGLARSQHAVLDRQICLPGARSADLVGAGLFTRREYCAVPALRGIPLGGALPPAFPDRPRRGAAELRPATADRRAARLRRARRADRRRALHEALFPGRQGRRRSHRDRLRGARGKAGQAHADASTAFSADCAAARRRSPKRRISASTTSASMSRETTFREGPRQSDPALLGRRPLRASISIPTATRLVTQSLKRIDAKLRANPEANRLFLEDPDVAPLARNGAAADERSRRARPVHPRFRPRRRA